MRKIIFIVLMGCTACLAQNTDAFILGQWYLADGCVPKKLGAWATYPTGSTKFCFSKTKPTPNVTTGKSSYYNDDQFIENVIWTFSSDKQGNLLLCEYVKDIVVSFAKAGNLILQLETKKYARYKNKYYWAYDNKTEVLHIFENKKLNTLLVTFKVDNKVMLTLVKQ